MDPRADARRRTGCRLTGPADATAVHSLLPSDAAPAPPVSGWTGTELSVRLRRGAGGSVRVDGVLCSAPVWFRWDGATLWLVGSGASPVGEDRVRVTVDVGAGLDVAVRSVAATVVYAARGDGTRWETHLRVAEGARVDWRPEPVILTRRARHDARTTVDAAAGAHVTLDDVLVLGRADEEHGSLRSTLDVQVEGERVLLTSIDTSVPGWAGPAGTDGARTVANRLVVGPRDDRLGPDRPTCSTPEAAGTVLEPADPCRLGVAVASSVDAARGALDALLPRPDDRT
ncbi:urease accessory protein UreD [Dermatobacter hominis]|uniref:urease accessory protein UreD n=1 Tax=Dermatobacter hominis TaxID=2884263 RepID=UPI001D11D86B|nr:urease accessory protein UreD [Dermatobacter hominis]UDY36560.1 urease accessory protein UreD [Dermatobacter hominis]